MTVESTNSSLLNFVYYSLDSIMFDICEGTNKDCVLDDTYCDLIKRLNQKQVLIISHVWEAIDPEQWKSYVEVLISRIKDKIPNLKVVQIANSWYKNQNAELINSDATYYVDFFLLRVFYLVIVKGISIPASNWNSNAKQFLFLTGKPNKINRVGLLHRLIKQGLENHMVWSLKPDFSDINSSSKYISEELSTEEFIEFVNKYASFPDKYFSLTGIPFETHIYTNKIFKLVSESDFDRRWGSPWITEKIWLAIVNRLPFIVAGEVKTTAVLQGLGLETFNDFLLIPNYDDPDSSNFLHYRKDYNQGDFILTHDDVEDWKEFYTSFKGMDWPDFIEFHDVKNMPVEWQEEISKSYYPAIHSWTELRLNAIIQNAKFWVDHIEQYCTQIQHSVENNYNRFVELGEENLKLIQNLIEKEGLNGNLLQYMVNRD